MFKDELAKIAKLIDDLIANDNFPDKIVPEYLRDAVRDYPSRGGKRLRPALLMWSCGLVGGIPESAKFAGASVEIYHNWTLVHDDIIDNDDFRRGQPSVHIKIAKFAKESFNLPELQALKYGTDMAMLAGDIQHGWAINMLMKSSLAGIAPDIIGSLCNKLQLLVNRDLISGEALDIELSVRPFAECEAQEIESMLTMKTGALLRFCAESGASIGLQKTDAREIAALGDFAECLGIAFQLRDDWLGIFGDEKKLGKPIGSDITAGKRTVLITRTIAMANRKDSDFVLKSLGNKKVDMERIRTAIRESGAEESVRIEIERLKIKALEILNGFPDSKYRELLGEMAGWMIERDN